MAEKPVIDSVAFILVDDDAFLVEERSPGKRVDPGKTCIPSGGVENGETMAEAVVREAAEELSVSVTRFHYVATMLYPYREQREEVDFQVHYFVVWDWDGEVRPREAENLSWTQFVDADTVLDIWPDRLAIQAMQEAELHQV